MTTEPTPIRAGAARLTRRRFLLGASAVAVAPLLPLGTVAFGASNRTPRVSPRAAKAAAVVASRHAAVADAGTAARLSVGYIKGSGRFRRLDARPWGRAGVLRLGEAIPATSLPRGDARLVGRVAIVTVHGLYPTQPSAAARGMTRLALDADFRADDPDSAFKFFAWTLRTGRARSVSGRSVFRITVTQKARLAFDMAVTRSGETALLTRKLGVGAGPELAKLRRGAYLLALRPDTWDAARRLPAVGDPAWRKLASILVTVDHE